MKIGIISDVHISYRQYGIIEREKDFYKRLEQIINDIIKQKIDIVLIAGDLFETHTPKPISIKIAQKCFQKLKENNIETYSIIGNHEQPNNRYDISPIKLVPQINILEHDKPVEFDDFNLIGVHYHRGFQHKEFEEKIKDIEKYVDKSKKPTILVVHQAFDKFFDINPEFKLEIIPKKFKYIFVGHLHNKYSLKWGNGKIISTGSPEIKNIFELKDYKLDGKGYGILDTENWEYKDIVLELPRELISLKIDYSNFDEKINELQDKLKKKENKPIIKLEITNVPSIEEINKDIHKLIKPYCLSVQTSIERIDEKILGIVDEDSFPTIEELIHEKLSHLSLDERNLAIDLYKANINKKNKEAVEEMKDISSKYFKKTYGWDLYE